MPPARRPRPLDEPVVAATGEALIWTDGACQGNPGPGGWATIVIPPGGGAPVELSGGEHATTNNRMELIAALEGLRWLAHAARVLVATDSEYLQKGMTAWLAGWKRRGWRTAGGGPVKNADLWRALEAEAARHVAVRWQWVRGHGRGAHAHPLNERADALAVAAAAAAARAR